MGNDAGCPAIAHPPRGYPCKSTRISMAGGAVARRSRVVVRLRSHSSHSACFDPENGTASSPIGKRRPIIRALTRKTMQAANNIPPRQIATTPFDRFTGVAHYRNADVFNTIGHFDFQDAGADRRRHGKAWLRRGYCDWRGRAPGTQTTCESWHCCTTCVGFGRRHCIRALAGRRCWPPE